MSHHKPSVGLNQDTTTAKFEAIIRQPPKCN